jgi:hypothetical protein
MSDAPSFDEAVTAVLRDAFKPFTCPRCGRQGQTTNPAKPTTCVCGFCCSEPTPDGLSPTMREALLYAATFGGAVHRHAGGFWSREDWPGKGEGHFGSSTIQALVARGFLVFDVWKDRKHTRSAAAMRFPIRSSLSDAGKAATSAWMVIRAQ